jgi:hypothetical protein
MKQYILGFLSLLIARNIYSQCCNWTPACGPKTVNAADHDCPCNQHCCGYSEVNYMQNYPYCVNNYSYKLLFSDEFDANKPLNTDFWQLINGKMSTEPEIQYYSPNNISITQNGELSITTTKENLFYGSGMIDGYIPFGPESFYAYSGSIKSKFRTPNEFGLVIARTKINESEGLRPAFWLFNGSYGWNEIDIFEYDEPTRMTMTLLHDIPNDYNPIGHCVESTNLNGSDGFHTYACAWNPSYIAIWVDEELKKVVWRYRDLMGYAVDCPPAGVYVNKTKIFPVGGMEIKFNVKVMDHGKMSSTSNMLIDYIRYYIKAPCDEEVVITDPNDIPNNDGQFNFIIGKNVTIDLSSQSNYIMQPNHHLKIIASENITIKPNFIANNYLVKELQPNLCDEIFGGTYFSNSTKSNDSNNLRRINDLYNLSKDSYNELIDSSENDIINIYPNPATNILTVNSSSNKYKDVTITIFDCNGKIVKSLIADSFPIDIELTNLISGIYFVNFSKNNYYFKTYKFVIQ